MKTIPFQKKRGNEEMEDVQDLEKDNVDLKKQNKEEKDHVKMKQTDASDVLVFMYLKDRKAATFKVNQMYEFVGILDHENTASEGAEAVLETEKDGNAFLPRLHCQEGTELSLFDLALDPKMKFTEEFTNVKEDATMAWEWLTSTYTNQSTLHDVRGLLLKHLSSLFYGDTLAAEYVLLNLISHVHTRLEAPVGAFPVNLVLGELNEDAKTVQFGRLQTAIEQLTTVCSTLSLTLSNLRQSSYRPEKNYQRNILEPGSLQLPDGATLLINELVLSAGKLNELGVRNLADLTKVIHQQQLTYDFEFYPLEFNTDMNVLVVSENQSILKAGLPVIVQSLPENNINAKVPVDESFLKLFRLYLSITRQLQFSMSDAASDRAQKYFIEQRKLDTTILASHFHQWLNIARLVSLSKGETSLSEETWNEMLALEKARSARGV